MNKQNMLCQVGVAVGSGIVMMQGALAAPVDFNLEKATISDIQYAMEHKGLTSVELINLYQRRIQRYNVSNSGLTPNPNLNAIIAVSPTLADEAAEADRLRRNGTTWGEMHGVPVMFKGSFSIGGMALTGGTTGWRNFIAKNDCWPVELLRKKGALIMGHANMDTWASSATTSTSQIQGTVRSCYLTGAYPGGSSGGSGVSAGAWLTFATFGGETGGSIRNPSDRSLCVGYKVSGGSISVRNIIPLAPERDVVGPITRNAVDNAVIRDIVGKLDPKDQWAPVLPILTQFLPVPETGFKAAIASATLAGKKIGIIGTFVGQAHPTESSATGATSTVYGVATTTDATKALVEKMKADMEAAGATVEYVFMPKEAATDYPLPAEVPPLLSGQDATNVLAWSHRGYITDAVQTPGESYDATARKVLAQASLVTQINSTTRAAMYTLNAETGLYEPGTAVDMSSQPGLNNYIRRWYAISAFDTWMANNSLDAVVWPVWANKGKNSGSIIARDAVNYQYHPAVTVPMGVLQYNETEKEGLTLNVTGRLFDDAKALGIAYAYEQLTHHRYSPPLAPALPGEEFTYDDYRTILSSPDTAPPVVATTNVATLVTTSGGAQVVRFAGTVKDSSGLDRVEITVNGAVVPSTVTGTKWEALVPAAEYKQMALDGTLTVNVMVLAVDKPGNATSDAKDVVLPAAPLKKLQITGSSSLEGTPVADVASAAVPLS